LNLRYLVSFWCMGEVVVCSLIIVNKQPVFELFVRVIAVVDFLRSGVDRHRMEYIKLPYGQVVCTYGKSACIRVVPHLVHVVVRISVQLH